jgi:hypothetical protein
MNEPTGTELPDRSSCIWTITEERNFDDSECDR